MKAFEIQWQSILTAVAVGAGLLVISASGQEESIETREMRAALEMAQSENASLRDALERAEVQRRTLVDSLAEAVRVSEEQVASARETQLKLQAFGVDLFAQDENSLEQRLLKAVRDLDITQQQLDERSKELHELGESFLQYLQATPGADEAERVAAREAIDSAGAALAEFKAIPAEPMDLSGSRVVSVDSEIGLVVFNSGRSTGLRVGTPIALVRDDRLIFSAMIVDVRDSISGAVLQDQLADIASVAVGDRVELLPNQPTF